LETLATYLSEWTNLPGEQDPQTKKDTAGPSSSKEQESGQPVEDVHVQYLRNIGQTVATLLDPLGEVELYTFYVLCYSGILSECVKLSS
jgi:hypothetical protein